MLLLEQAKAANAGDPVLMFRFHKVTSKIARRFRPQVANAWLNAVGRFQGSFDMNALRRALAGGTLVAVEAAVRPSNFAAMMKDLEDPFARTAAAAGTASAQVLDTAGFPAQFNAVHPDVVLFARDQAADLVVRTTKDVKEAIRTVLAVGAQQGLTTAQQAIAIREVIALPPNWVKAPMHLADDIRNGRMASATARRLSAVDKQMIRSRMLRGTANETFIGRMQKRYAERLLNRRARNIARTETLRSANFGQQNSWEQAMQQGALPADSVRFWIVTPDSRLSEEHAGIPDMNPNGRRMDEPFETTEGFHMYPPSRPNCRCGIGLGIGTGEVAPTLPSSRVPSTLPSLPMKKVAKKKRVLRKKVAKKKVAKKKVAKKKRRVLRKKVVKKKRRVLRKKVAKKKVAKKKAQPKDVLAQPSSKYPKLKESDETLGRFQRPDGSFTLERQRLHDAIVDMHFKGITAVEDPQVMIMGGGPASGKSAMLRQAVLKNHVEIDVDAIRVLLPEFKEGVRAGNKAIAAMTHEESSLLGKRIAKEAVRRRYNVMVDGTGDSSYEKLAAKIKGFRTSGHRVVANYVTVDTETAVARSIARGQRTGRYVPETYMREVHRSVSSVFDKAVRNGLFDEATLWDTNGAEMLKVAHAIGNKLQVLEEKAWRRFLWKAQETGAESFTRAGGFLTDSSGVVVHLDKRFANYTPRPKQLEVLRKYQGSFDVEEDFVDTLYYKINSRLRAGHTPGSAALPFGEGELGGMVTRLDMAIADAPTMGEKVVLWRGGKLPLNARVGDTIIDRGFVSTTADRATAENFWADQISTDVTLVRIGVAEGQRGLWMPKLVGGDLVSEAEFTLARGTQFRVVRIRQLTFEQYEAEFGKTSQFLLKAGERFRVVDVEIIGGGS